MRKLRSKIRQRDLEKFAADFVELDWLNRCRSQASVRVSNLIRRLRDSHLLCKRLRASGSSLPATTVDAKQLLKQLDEVNQVLALYRGVRVLWVEEDYSVTEFFGFDSGRLQRNDAYYTETRLLNYALELFRNGSIHRLHTCTECGKWFYAGTDRQVYCSPACRQKNASHNDGFKKRRREYMRAYRRAEKERDNQAKTRLRRKA
jgi:hypothetical protein